MHDQGDCYVLRHLALFTGLTDRTLRAYLAAGLLKGEKINGLWHFTPRQVEEFIRHPAVQASIQARSSAHVGDFLLDRRKQREQCCLILDVPGDAPGACAEFFCSQVNGSCAEAELALEWTGSMLRVILTGPVEAVLRAAAAWKACAAPTKG